MKIPAELVQFTSRDAFTETVCLLSMPQINKYLINCLNDESLWVQLIGCWFFFFFIDFLAKVIDLFNQQRQYNIHERALHSMNIFTEPKKKKKQQPMKF